MKIPTKEAIDQLNLTLVDVRKAFRLLHDYQKMVLDAVDYMGKQLGLTYVGGWPKFGSAGPREGRGKPDLPAWDWLNMIFYEFHFEGERPGGDTLMLSVLLISDTGYFAAEDERLQKTNVAGWEPAKKSSTKLAFVASPSAKEWEMGFLWDKAEMKSFLETGGELPVRCKNIGMIGRCVDLAQIATEQETDALLDELVHFAVSSGVPLKRINQDKVS